MDKYTGQTIGIYTVLDKNKEKTNDGHVLYTCRCNVCGGIFNRRMSEIQRRHDRCKHIYTCWGMERLGKIFNNMVRRCYNSKSRDYQWYGGKGIRICDEWVANPIKFEEWSLNNGYSDSLSIDRIDPTKNYSPDNCRWIPLEENSRKAGKVNWITIDDICLTGQQWSKKLKLGRNRINTLIRAHGLEKTILLIRAIIKNPELKDKYPLNVALMHIYNIK